MGKFGDVKYIVNVLDGDRWTIFTDAPSKGMAIKAAKALLATGDHDAVKVTEDRGQMQELVVFELKSSGWPAPSVTVSPVEEAPYCKKLAEFYSFDARVTLGRLLRQHLDQEGMTPSELIHDPYKYSDRGSERKIVYTIAANYLYFAGQRH